MCRTIQSWRDSALGFLYRVSESRLYGKEPERAEPRVEVVTQRVSLGDSELASSRLEEQKNRSCLQTELISGGKEELELHPKAIGGRDGNWELPARVQGTYRHESVAAIIEVQDSEEDFGITSLVPLHPLTAQQVQLGAKFTAHLAAIASIHRRQKHSNRVVARSGGDLLVGGIIKLDRRAGQALLVEIEESLAGFVGQDACKEQRERKEDRGPAHRGS